jgi:signal transduction histidine kinase
LSNAEQSNIWKTPSLRWRIAVMTAALVLVSIFLLATILILAFEERNENLIEQIVNQQLEHSMSLWQRAPELASPNTPHMQLYHQVRGKPAPGLPPYLANLAVGHHEIFDSDVEYHASVRDDASGRFILAYDVRASEEQYRFLVFMTIFTAVLVTLVTLFAVYLLAKRLTRHLEALATSIDQSHGNYAKPGMERELLVVAQALDAHEARQAAQLERESAFSANLSHELRTPLSSIRSDAELVAEMPDLPPAARRRAERIIATADRISSLASSLLALARAQNPGVRQSVALAPALLEIWASLLPAYTDKNGHGITRKLDLEMPDSAMVDADPALLRLVLRNLLDNALRYTPDAQVRCELEGNILSVLDRGQGFLPEALPFVFDRFYHSGNHISFGIGLALVKHIADASGWQASASNAEGGGGKVSIDFGSAMMGNG